MHWLSITLYIVAPIRTRAMMLFHFCKTTFMTLHGSHSMRLGRHPGRMCDQQIYSSLFSEGEWSNPYPTLFQRLFCKHDAFPSVKWIVVLIGIIWVQSAKLTPSQFPENRESSSSSIFSIKSSSHIFTTGVSDSFLKWVQWPKCKVQNSYWKY